MGTANHPLGTPESGWGEDVSDSFIRNGHILVPSRWEQISTIASLIPAHQDENFSAVELACGAGVLSQLILSRFSQCRLIALDGSPRMLAKARETLGELGTRATFRRFDLRERDWLNGLPPARCFVSSLAIHHLDGGEKRELFQALLAKLEPGGALLIADLIEPPNEYARALYAGAYDAEVREQAMHVARSIEPYRFFHDSEWNHFKYPDVEFDKPSGLFEQLTWLREAGFAQVDCFWSRAGHAVYGGVKQKV